MSSRASTSRPTWTSACSAKPGVGLHEPRRDPLLGLVELVPVRHALGPRGQLGRLRARCRAPSGGPASLALGVPAGVEPAGVLVAPLRRDVERRVRGAERDVGEERPLGRDRLLVLDPGDRVVDEVLGEVVAVLREPVGLDGVAALVELRVPVVHLRAHEAVEEVEALTHRPPRERARRAHLHRRGLVPLADRRRAVAVAAEDLRDRRGAGRPVAVVAGLRRRHLARDAHADRVVVAPGHQRLAGRRAQRRDVEPAVAQPLVRQPLRRRHLARSAVRRRRAEPHVVDQHDDDVRARPAPRCDRRGSAARWCRRREAAGCGRAGRLVGHWRVLLGVLVMVNGSLWRRAGAERNRPAHGVAGSATHRRAHALRAGLGGASWRRSW